MMQASQDVDYNPTTEEKCVDHVEIDTSSLVENAAASEAAEGATVIVWDNSHLPPMPEPRESEMRGEAIGGIICVSIIIIGQLVFGHVVVVSIGGTSLVVTIIFLTLLYLDAVLAVYCLLMILNSDPGVVSRSPEVCEPLPAAVRTKLDAGEKLDGIRVNPTNPATKQTFCVRCCLWRPPGGHHCRTCNRCVVKFDHHCGVFGRCIAGDQSLWADAAEPIPGTTGSPGNMPYFNGILYAGGIATGLNLVFFIVSFAT